MINLVMYFMSGLLKIRKQPQYSLLSNSSIVLKYPKGCMLGSFGDRP